MKPISRAIQEAIKSTGWSDLTWARKLDVTYQTVWGWRNGKQDPHQRNILAIAQVLGWEVVISDDKSECEFKALRQELPGNVQELFQLMRWEHWTIKDGKEMRFDRFTGIMQEFNRELNEWVALGNDPLDSED
ncbi:MAG: helix-turn-helix transcriptional regulator [Candidatus Neomarinimicrobiota bacterium]